MPVAILCGGQGTRLYPETLTKPKAMVTVLTKPFIWHQLHYLHREGVRDVVLCTGKFSDQIKHYVGDGSLWGLNVKYSEDGDIPLGTGGAIKKALPELGFYFGVMNGDTYFPLDLARAHHYYYLSHKWARMYKYRGTDCGYYMFSKSLFEQFKADAFDLWDLLNPLIEKRQVEQVITETKFYDIGTPEGLKETEEYLWSLVQP